MPNTTPFFEALRTALSRARANAVFEAGPTSDPTISYTGSWADTSSTKENSGDGFSTTTVDDSSVAIDVPAEFEGGAISLGFVVQPDSEGTVSIAVTGASEQTASRTMRGSELADVMSSSAALVTQRLTNLNPGAQTITVTFTGLSGTGLGFDYWEAEAANPPLCLVPNFWRVPNPSFWTTGGFAFSDDDALMAAYNAAESSLSAEWDQNVVVFDADGALNKDPTLFAPDGVHLNDSGSDRVAQAAAAAVPVSN